MLFLFTWVCPFWSTSGLCAVYRLLQKAELRIFAVSSVCQTQEQNLALFFNHYYLCNRQVGQWKKWKLTGMKIARLLVFEFCLQWSQQELEEDCVNCETKDTVSTHQGWPVMELLNASNPTWWCCCEMTDMELCVCTYSWFSHMYPHTLIYTTYNYDVT